MLIEIRGYMSNLDSLSLYYRPLQYVLTQSLRQESFGLQEQNNKSDHR
jgi:hypothetical protein